MLKTSGSTESTTRPGKGRVGVGGNGNDKINDDATSSMLRTSSSTDSSTSMTQIVVEYDGVDNGGGRSGDFDRKFHLKLQYNSRAIHPLTSMLRTSSSTDSSTSATQSAVKYDEVDGGGKLVEKSSKSRKIVKKPKKPQRSEKIAKAIGSEERLPKHRSSVN